MAYAGRAGTLYLYALGMGLPLVAITLFGNRLLPKVAVDADGKRGFWLCDPALPVFLLERVIATPGIAPVEPAGRRLFRMGFISSLKSQVAGYACCKFCCWASC